MKENLLSPTRHEISKDEIFGIITFLLLFLVTINFPFSFLGMIICFIIYIIFDKKI